jgi:hypothetical protein
VRKHEVRRKTSQGTAPDCQKSYELRVFIVIASTENPREDGSVLLCGREKSANNLNR